MIEWHNNANNREAWVRGVLNDMTHNVAQKRGYAIVVIVILLFTSIILNDIKTKDETKLKKD